MVPLQSRLSNVLWPNSRRQNKARLAENIATVCESLQECPRQSICSPFTRTQLFTDFNLVNLTSGLGPTPLQDPIDSEAQSL
ncbi:hypothetical protein Trydic_g4358 [Trypoxylus dichotomus]